VSCCSWPPSAFIVQRSPVRSKAIVLPFDGRATAPVTTYAVQEVDGHLRRVECDPGEQRDSEQ
jgi:hypothetical protein